MFSNRVRVVVTGWLVLSVAVFVVRLGAVLGRYRAAEQKFADLDFEARRPAAPVIVNEPDSPSPELTLSLTGRAIRNLDVGRMGWAQATFPFQNTMDLVANRKGYHVDLIEDRVTYEFPRRKDSAGGLHAVAVSQRSHIMATVGEFTVVQFWNAFNGDLLATVEDEHPTIAARPDESQIVKRHANKLRYQETDARRIAASPQGCLFAIGKVDGTVELWGNLAYRDHPELMNEQSKSHPRSLDTPQQFGLISRRKVHEGQVVDLAFSHGGTKLVSVGGDVVTGYGPAESYSRHTTPPSAYELVLSAGSSLEDEWRQPLPGAPGQLALPIQNRHPFPGQVHFPFAVGMLHKGIIVGNLDQRKITETLTFPAGGPSVRVQSLSFHRHESRLMTLHTSFSGSQPDTTIETVLSLWQISSRRRIATARFAGHFMSAGWDDQGLTLALLRYNPALHKTPPTRTQILPWSSPAPSSFLFHVWNVMVTQTASE